MVAARQSEPNPFAAAEDLRKHVIRLLQADGEETKGNILVLPQVFLEFLDYDHKMALFLNKLLYWTERTKHPQKWVYKSYREWFQELGFKESVIRRLLYGDPSTKRRKRTLSDLGVEVKVKRAPNGSPTCHYRINLAVFLDAIRRFLAQKQGLTDTCEPADSAGWKPGNPQDGSSGSPRLELAESAGTFDQGTTTQILSEENSIESSDAATAAEDDFQIFAPYEKRFGKLKDGFHELLRTELARLGQSRVGEVLERCATRGRSWNYAVRALANEASPAPATQTSVTWADVAYTGQAGEPPPFCVPQQAEPALRASERVQTPWSGFGGAVATVLDAWDAAYQQLELQLRGSFDPWGRDLTLVDFEPATQTFILLARNQAAQEMLKGRLDRTIKRILGDVYGQPVAVQYLLKEAWRLREGEVGEAVAIA